MFVIRTLPWFMELGRKGYHKQVAFSLILFSAGSFVSSPFFSPPFFGGAFKNASTLPLSSVSLWLLTRKVAPKIELSASYPRDGLVRESLPPPPPLRLRRVLPNSRPRRPAGSGEETRDCPGGHQRRGQGRT